VLREDPRHSCRLVFAEALVRLAAMTGAEDDRHMAEHTLSRLSSLAAAQPLGHTTILNALDLNLRGLTVVVANDRAGNLKRTALRLPHLERTVCAVESTGGLAADHPAKAVASGREGAHALICAGMRCSLPVTSPDGLTTTAREMLALRDAIGFTGSLLC